MVVTLWHCDFAVLGAASITAWCLGDDRSGGGNGVMAVGMVEVTVLWWQGWQWW